MGKLSGKVALVTGGARGQGRAHALALAAEGADIAILDICEQIATVPYDMSRPDDLAGTVKEVEALDRRVSAHQVDMRDGAAVQSAVDAVIAELGAIDVLVVNHGIWTRGALWDLSEDEWQDMIDVNLTAVWRALKSVGPHMVDRLSGAIVLTSSVNGMEGQAGSAHYTAAKHGVLGLMRSAALEFAPFGIRVNAICPGFVDTAMTNWQGCYDMTGGKPGSTREDHERNSRHWHAIGGLIQPAEVSGAVVWLASDDASRVTGVALPVDAGHLVLPAFTPAPV